MNTKEVLSALDWLTKNGDLFDYDDEIADRIEDAKDIIRSHDRLLEAAKGVIAHPGLYGPYRDALQAAIAAAEEQCAMTFFLFLLSISIAIACVFASYFGRTP